mmetsp:Transcript_30819/g.89635  ORF Transcript_30819/g.89635 Transcript_30819/m.89635 type:complete len:275 (+) Transcript_30819:228-1052(+)
MAMGAKALPRGQPRPLSDNSLLNQDATAFSLTQPPAAAAGSSSDRSQEALPSTETELRQMHYKLNIAIRELEEAITTVTVECRSLQTVLQSLQREYAVMRNQVTTGLTVDRLHSLKTAAAIEAFKQDIKHAREALRDLSREVGKREALLEGDEKDTHSQPQQHQHLVQQQQQQQPSANDNGDAAVERGSCVACRDDKKPPVITFFPCKQTCLCEECWQEWRDRHERAKADKERLEAAGRPVPEEVRRYAVLRCPACGMDAVHADSLSDVRVTTD